MKVNYAPYLAIIDLKEEIVDDAVIARFEDGLLVLECPKVVHQLWGELLLTGGKITLKARRDAAVDVKTLKEQERMKAVKDRKHADEKTALRKSMALEDEERNRLDDLKAAEKAQAEVL